VAYFHLMTREAIDKARPLFDKAIELDPEFATAYGFAAWCVFWRKFNGWMNDPEREIEEGARLARRAVELGKNDAIALTRGGHALGHFGGELNGCIALVDKALVLNPNLAAAWYLGAFQRIAAANRMSRSSAFSMSCASARWIRRWCGCRRDGGGAPDSGPL
jgi:tetratricopeptide (TPR) repeat protein